MTKNNYLLPALAVALALPTAPWSLHGQSRVDPEVFFKAGPTVPASLPADALYPQGRMFPFSFFSLGAGMENQPPSEEEHSARFERYKDSGFQMFGPQYELNARSLKDAAKYGLKAAFTVKFGKDGLFHGKEAVAINPEEVRSEISKQVAAVADNPAIALWYLQPEELRPWRKNEMTFLEAATQAIREADPQKRPIWIYDPAHANAGRLAAIAPWVDYLGKGNYVNYASMRESRIWSRWSIEQEIQAIKQAGSKAIPLMVAEMYHDSHQPPMKPGDIAEIPRWVAHDNWLALITGAKGIVVFSLRQRPSLPPEAWEAYYKAYEKLGQLLLGDLNLGQILLFGEPRDDISVEVTSGPKEVEMIYPSGGVKEPLYYPSVSHLNVAYGPDRYLFLVNSSNDPIEAVVGGLPYASVKAQSLLDGERAFNVGEGEFNISLAPLEPRVYKLTRQ